MADRKKLMPKVFKGVNVFMSRKLVPPEIFDTLHDALKQNGAEVNLCCDPSRTGPNDYHIISSPEHEKFEDLRAKGCNLLGPQCVLSCAKENRALPKQGFTCCLAMDGVKVLASGFEKDEKVKIEKLVTAMGGVLQTKASMDVNFVIARNVLAAKYKWASNVLKKPVVTISWLNQCWNEHRVVPQEPYRVPPFSGLTICTTRIPADERKELEKLVIQNGGKYSADLTKNCTHLVADTPEGDKYKVARKWGHIHIVTRKWVNQSIAKRACLGEESYPIQGVPNSSSNAMKSSLKRQHDPEKCNGNSQTEPSSVIGNSNMLPSSMIADPDLETSLSQNMSSTFSDATIFTKEEGNGEPRLQPEHGTNFDGCVADDSQAEDSDLYLSECRISLVGFQTSEMRKLVHMVRKGGGSRYMSFNEKLTHIVVGTPSESEKKEVRAYAAFGVIYVVRPSWLEDCVREKREVPVSLRHVASDLLLPRAVGTSALKQGKSSAASFSLPAVKLVGNVDFESGISLENNRGQKPETNIKGSNYVKPATRSFQKSMFSVLKDDSKVSQKLRQDSDAANVQNGKSSNVFKGKIFRFSSSFPQDRRDEIVEWVKQGGGALVDDQVKNVHFTIECHGLIQTPADNSQAIIVSSHWIRSCLEDGCMLEVDRHILYSPLPCRIPLPGFDGFCFCVSQYEEKDRLLLRNLCFVLGAKFTEKLSRKVTHLICKFTSGPKYEAACKWGIEAVTFEWICECIMQDKIVALDQFLPKEATAQDREGGLCTMSQYPTQAACMISRGVSFQLPSQSQVMTKIETNVVCSRSESFSEGAKHSSLSIKRPRLVDDDSQTDFFSSEIHQDGSLCKIESMRNRVSEDGGEISHAVPDVAAAIEDLLAQTSKIQDMKLPGGSLCDQSLFSTNHSILGQEHLEPRSTFGISNSWLNRTWTNDFDFIFRNEKQDNLCTPGQGVKEGTYDGFSETQTESQVVGYEEDLSGRQMIIDRVRTRSSMT
ncbi:DNA topoisomerase 2-binding protein 1-A-like isoform X2 [Macadamia integrifolia]|uniref:DNA topoisomerase 2-binding protein 1-A-like isoform X2 n=1 Tax=Macadamia integrifolia TaxID=60698 RepID=UPI001C531F5B|nr:DNA topoisomerase 2-binding protein 1-A-like isoform X2 [Macadamia integrifolia]